MADWMVVMLFSVGAVLFFAVGLSLTLIFKGHNIDSEIATNRNMQARGITCAAQEARKNTRGGEKSQYSNCAEICADNSCAGCENSQG